jgi:aspartate aminotransferase-like enzyme
MHDARPASLLVSKRMHPGPSSDLDSVKRWWSYHDLHEHHPASQAAALKVLQKLMRFLQTAKNDR